MYCYHTVVGTYLPVTTLLAGEAFQMVDVGSGPHHHLEGRDDLGTTGLELQLRTS